MTLLPSLAQIAAPLLQHDPLHRWAARTNQLNLTWKKTDLGKVSSSKNGSLQPYVAQNGIKTEKSRSCALCALHLQNGPKLCNQTQWRHSGIDAECRH